ncbi:hypothetical protein CXB51_004015 [Gossypium anomalum]|uniref:Uncharacterized protein n=1 Tax=Gossypium anomalum TaxID=47600 RepID=A0A8J5Z7Q3_9ROSI|nr:hypothetical protein CXB51_004015 [Gossypium anomalum]
MASLKYEILLLNRNTRFALWQIKIQTDVMKEKTATALWKRLEQICMSKTLTSKLHMKQRLYAHCLEKGASVHEHLTVFKEILSNLEAMEVQYDKEDLGLILLCSLPSSYSTFRDTILYTRESLTVDEVYDSLSTYDKMKHQGESLIARGRQDQNDSNDRGRAQERNSRGKSKGRSKSSNRGKTCNFCKKKGYIKSECYKLQNKIKREVTNQKRKQPENFGEADVVEDYSDGELLVASVNDSKVSEEWILDSGCTFHMSPSRDWFTTYETVSEGVVLMKNNTSCKIASVGTIKVKMLYGVVRTLSDVRHVPKLKINLISLSTLDLKGYRYTAETGVLKISKGSLVVMKGQKKTAKLYVLQGSIVTGDAAVASSFLSDDDITKLWHMHLGHMSENGMVELSKRRLLDGQGICKLNFCEHCIFGKQKRVRFTRGIHNTKGTLEYIHSDLWGPSRVPSRGGANYMLTFIDDFSRKVWVFFLKQKSDVFSIVQVRRDRETLDKVASTACFLINRFSSVAIEKKTPQEVWSGNPANYSDLKIFGCPVYAYVCNRKLEPRSIKCVFLGYKAGVKGVDSSSQYKIENRVASSPQYSITKNRTRREIKHPKKYTEADLGSYALNVAEDIDANQESSNYSEADLVKLPKGKKIVHCKWVFKKKEGTLGVKEPRYKARLVAKGYSQIPGVDFIDVFSPVVKHSSIRALLGIVAMHDLELEQLDFCIENLRRIFTCNNQRSAKPVSTPLVAYFRLSSALSPQSVYEIEYMSHVPCSSVVGSLMYTMKKISYRLCLYNRRFTIGGCVISWKAILQTTVALSTTEAEYMEITEACKEAIWLKGLFSELLEDLQISTVFVTVRVPSFL